MKITKRKKAMKELLNEIDELLAHFEDFTHGKDGKDITKMRGKIAMTLRQCNVNEQVCKCKGGAVGRTVTADFEHQICDRCGNIAK